MPAAPGVPGLLYLGGGRIRGGREAIDAVMKIKAGLAVPKELTLPSRVFTAANIDQGGELLK